MNRFMESFRSIISEEQINAMDKLLETKKVEEGLSDEDVKKLKEELIQKIDPDNKPTFTPRPAEAKTDANAYNEMMDELYTDLCAVFTENMVTEDIMYKTEGFEMSHLKEAEKRIRKLKNDLLAARAVADQSDGSKDSHTEDFTDPSQEFERTGTDIDNNSGLLILESDTKNSVEFVGQDYQNGNQSQADAISDIHEIIRHPKDSGDTATGTYINMVSVNDDRNVLDWREVYVNPAPTTVYYEGRRYDGVVAEFIVKFLNKKTINEISLEPFCMYPFDILGIQYSDITSRGEVYTTLTLTVDDLQTADGYKYYDFPIMCDKTRVEVKIDDTDWENVDLNTFVSNKTEGPTYFCVEEINDENGNPQLTRFRFNENAILALDYEIVLGEIKIYIYEEPFWKTLKYPDGTDVKFENVSKKIRIAGIDPIEVKELKIIINQPNHERGIYKIGDKNALLWNEYEKQLKRKMRERKDLLTDGMKYQLDKISIEKEISNVLRMGGEIADINFQDPEFELVSKMGQDSNQGGQNNQNKPDEIIVKAGYGDALRDFSYASLEEYIYGLKISLGSVRYKGVDRGIGVLVSPQYTATDNIITGANIKGFFNDDENKPLLPGMSAVKYGIIVNSTAYPILPIDATSIVWREAINVDEDSGEYKLTYLATPNTLTIKYLSDEGAIETLDDSKYTVVQNYDPEFTSGIVNEGYRNFSNYVAEYTVKIVKDDGTLCKTEYGYPYQYADLTAISGIVGSKTYNFGGTSQANSIVLEHYPYLNPTDNYDYGTKEWINDPIIVKVDGNIAINKTIPYSDNTITEIPYLHSVNESGSYEYYILGKTIFFGDRIEENREGTSRIEVTYNVLGDGIQLGITLFSNGIEYATPVVRKYRLNLISAR